DSWIVYRNAPSTAAGNDRYFEVAQIPFTTTTPEISDNTLDSALYTDETTHATEIDLDGPKITSSTLLQNVTQRDGASYEKLFPTDGVLQFTGTKGGRTLSTKEYTVTSTSTVGDLLTFFSEAMGIQASDPTTGIPQSVDLVHVTDPPTYISPGGLVQDGRIQITGNNGVDNAVGIQTSGLKFLHGTSTDTINLQFSTYQDARGQSAASDFVAYNSLGISCNVRLTAVLESRDNSYTTYRWFADSPDNLLSSGDPDIAVGTGLIKFDGDGKFVTATNPTVSIYREGYPSSSPLQFDFNFDNMSGLAEDSSTIAISRQDGSSAGVLNDFIIGEDGLVTGVFSNGINRDLGQVLLARFSNPAGLEQKGENMFIPGMNSGLPVVGTPGQQGLGSLVAGAVELSNADIGNNLINLITASTMYRGNARVITTVQQLFDELLLLNR
ncbi:MAG: flagellar hook-basal body complex protein, partial [Thermoguttaceae bacterium]